ncbi:hypothetical protein HispidOSU_031688 [Sigmodon hispidus]
MATAGEPHEPEKKVKHAVQHAGEVARIYSPISMTASYSSGPEDVVITSPMGVSKLPVDLNWRRADPLGQNEND